MTVGPFGEGAEVKISPIPRSVMVHARSIVASRVGAAGYKLMRLLARDMELIAKTRPGNKDVTNKRDSHATQTTTTLTTSASYKIVEVEHERDLAPTPCAATERKRHDLLRLNGSSWSVLTRRARRLTCKRA